MKRAGDVFLGAILRRSIPPSLRKTEQPFISCACSSNCYNYDITLNHTNTNYRKVGATPPNQPTPAKLLSNGDTLLAVFASRVPILPPPSASSCCRRRRQIHRSHCRSDGLSLATPAAFRLSSLLRCPPQPAGSSSAQKTAFLLLSQLIVGTQKTNVCS